MEKVKWRILSVLVIMLSIIVLFCFSKKYAEKEMMEIPAAEEKIGNAVLPAAEDKKEEEDAWVKAFIAGLSKNKLSEEVVLALEKGDSKFLAGVEFGEAFDYDLYRTIGDNEYSIKIASVFSGSGLRYFFDGKGHRFSGFSYTYGYGCEPFLGIERGDPVAILLEAFGTPDECEECMISGEQGLCASWYFDRAVLTLYESDAEIIKIEYRAAEGVADGPDVQEKSDFERRMEHLAAHERVEAIYRWGLEAGDRDVCFELPENISGREDIEEFVENYLREQGFEEKEPDSVIYDEKGERYAEGYIDDERGRYCFILYGSRSVKCAVRDIGKADKTEYLVYSLDEAGNVVQETQYDSWGMRMAEASYVYHEGVPFPFLKEGWNLSYYDGEGESFGRNYKTWFPEKNTELDQAGKVATVRGDGNWDVKSFLRYVDHFSYRADGKLDTIREEIPPGYAEEIEEYLEAYPDDRDQWFAEYFAEIEFRYGRGGMLKKIDYHRNNGSYGTWEQYGSIDFDSRERMVYDHYYVTHGYHSRLFYYQEEEERPWAIGAACGGYFEDIVVYRPISQDMKTESCVKK